MQKQMASCLLIVCALSITSCSGTNTSAQFKSNSSRVGQRALDFTTMDTQLGAKTVVLGTNGAAPSAELPLVSPIFTSATQAADAFSRSIVAHDIAGAFSVLSARDRLKVGDPVHFELLLSDNAAWRSAKTSSVDASNIAQFDVTQDPALDEVRGDVASLATVRLPMVNETAGWKVAWSKRSIEQHYLSTDEPAGGANNTTNATTGKIGRAHV